MRYGSAKPCMRLTKRPQATAVACFSHQNSARSIILLTRMIERSLPSTAPLCYVLVTWNASSCRDDFPLMYPSQDLCPIMLGAETGKLHFVPKTDPTVEEATCCKSLARPSVILFYTQIFFRILTTSAGASLQDQSNQLGHKTRHVFSNRHLITPPIHVL